ncbi:MAG: PAS domain S-box protein [Spirochaetales bacterium]|nr:PAS domain S-box protein [Spirochaetales bacterium]
MDNKYKKTLLLVEDEIIIAMAKKQELGKYGYNTIHAMTGEAAVTLVRERQDINMVLMDIDLGRGIDGTEAAELILKDKEIPIVFLSSHTESEIVERTNKITSYGYVVKSSGISVLNSSIKAAFELFDTNLKVDKNIRLLEDNCKRIIERENDFSTIINSIGDAVLTADIKGYIVRINPAAEKLTGWKINKCREKSVSEVFKIINIRTKKTIINPIEKVLESGQIEELAENTTLISREGVKFQITGIAIPIRNDAGSINRVVIVFREISEEYQLQKEFNKFDTPYKFAVEGSALGLWDWNIETGEVLFSKKTRVMLGFDESKISGSSKECRNLVHPDDRKYFYDNINRHLNAATSMYQDEFRVLSKGGNYKWILARGMVVARTEDWGPDRMLGTIVDVTKRRQAEETLRIERDNFINIFNSMKDGVFIIDQEYNIKYFNPAIKKDFGDLYSTKCYEYFYQCTEKCSWCEMSKVIAGEKINKEINFQISQKTYDMMCTPITNSDSTISMLAILRDITIRKKAEEEIKNQLLEKDVVLKEVHHRIKNNFASIVGLLSMQASSLTDYSAVSALNDAIGRVKSYQILYEKLLLSDDFNVTSIKQYLDNLIDEIVSLSLFPESIEISVEKNIDDFQLDPKRLVSFGIVVNELLTNVMKYAFAGRTSGLIQVTLKKNEGHITLTIQDDGNGLPDGFDLENQTGFGLLLVGMLTKQFEGDFTIENHNGTRSIMKFSI